MLEISEERAATADNYIGFFGFMNIIAIGLLLYVARLR
jgi:hypothetical protein